VNVRVRLGVVVVIAGLPLLLPAVASAHAYLTKTVPAASVTLGSPPSSVQLTFDEAVEPRFAIVSVTDVDAHQEATGSPTRSPANPNTLVVPLRRIGEGWYLVYWRAISVDGHPVQGAFTFAVGPSPGPAPQFTIPHLAGTATSKPLVIAKWVAFLATMIAIGLFVLRSVIARPVVGRVAATSLRPLTIAFGAAALLGLIAIPCYLEEATAIDSLRSFFDVKGVLPLWRVTAYGRGVVDLELCFALFCVAALITLWLDRPKEPRRSVAAIIALSGAVLGAAATLVLPGTIGHAGQTAPRAVAVGLDWLHLVSGSIWVGGLIGLLILWFTLPTGRRVAALGVCVPRFSNVAFVSVMALLGSGVGGAVLHLPILSALWLTTYGKVILIKAGILLATMLIASINLLRTKPGLARSATADSSARLLRTLVGVEALLVTGAIFMSAILSSLAPPPPSFAQVGSSLATVGPGAVASTVTSNGYTLRVLVNPNKAVAPNSFAVQITRAGKPIRGANVTLSFAMLDMQMPNQEYQLTETSPGVYSRQAPALVMVGHWGLSFNVTPSSGQPFTALVVDHAAG
jgi:copper transport protein